MGNVSIAARSGRTGGGTSAFAFWVEKDEINRKVTRRIACGKRGQRLPVQVDEPQL